MIGAYSVATRKKENKMDKKILKNLLRGNTCDKCNRRKNSKTHLVNGYFLNEGFCKQYKLKPFKNTCARFREEKIFDLSEVSYKA